MVLKVALDEQGMLRMQLQDDGAGMDAQTLRHAQDPFFTSRTTRRVGLGLAMMAGSCRLAGGILSLTSKPGQGTILTATVSTAWTDCLPLGDLAASMAAFAAAYPDAPDFLLHCQSPAGETQWDSREIKRAYGDHRAFYVPEVIAWMRASMQENIQPIFGGVIL